MNVKRELRRLIRGALVDDGGTGGRRHCQYCLRESYKGQVEHYRVGFRGEDGPEADEPCAVDVMRAALKLLAEGKK